MPAVNNTSLPTINHCYCIDWWQHRDLWRSFDGVKPLGFDGIIGFVRAVQLSTTHNGSKATSSTGFGLGTSRFAVSTTHIWEVTGNTNRGDILLHGYHKQMCAGLMARDRIGWFWQDFCAGEVVGIPICVCVWFQGILWSVVRNCEIYIFVCVCVKQGKHASVRWLAGFLRQLHAICTAWCRRLLPWTLRVVG